jgi:hypothetical protein
MGELAPGEVVHVSTWTSHDEWSRIDACLPAAKLAKENGFGVMPLEILF